MNKNKYLVALAIALVAAAAYAAVDKNVSLVNDPRPQHFPNGIYVGKTATVGNKITTSLGGSATIDFTAATAGSALSSSITVTGAKAGDPCSVGVPTAAAALKASFTCYVDATNSVKVQFTPNDTQHGTCTLNNASPSLCTATVSAGAQCTASIVGGTAAIAALGVAVAVSSTTLTVTSANTRTEAVIYDCMAPVDPASGTFYVRVESAQ